MERKICTGCQENKPIEDFSWANKSIGKRKSKCRLCTNADHKVYYESGGGRETHRLAHIRNRDERIGNMRNYIRTDKQEGRYDPLKGPAHIAVYRAVKSGKMTKPDLCEECGKTCIPEGHHHKGYSKEHRLDIVWLCRDCHDLADHPEFAKAIKETSSVSTDFINW